jgi:hypothetical protein
MDPKLIGAEVNNQMKVDLVIVFPIKSCAAMRVTDGRLIVAQEGWHSIETSLQVILLAWQ